MKNKDVRIEQDLCYQYVVAVWNNYRGWVSVTRHRYFSSAEEVQRAILEGKDRECVKDLVSKQDTRCNEYIARYYENWA